VAFPVRFVPEPVALSQAQHPLHVPTRPGCPGASRLLRLSTSLPLPSCACLRSHPYRALSFAFGASTALPGTPLYFRQPEDRRGRLPPAFSRLHGSTVPLARPRILRLHNHSKRPRSFTTNTASARRLSLPAWYRSIRRVSPSLSEEIGTPELSRTVTVISAPFPPWNSFSSLPLSWQYPEGKHRERHHWE